ncbi:MAG: hypothetical protein C0518_13880 [Opitutus sp.]|nr:hypothetical protein [Opitutus sp.]
MSSSLGNGRRTTRPGGSSLIGGRAGRLSANSNTTWNVAAMKAGTVNRSVRLSVGKAFITSHHAAERGFLENRETPLPSAPLTAFTSRVKPTDLAFSQALGLRPAPPGAAHLLELPIGDRVRNHIGTMHAAAQFALAEAASAACLQRDFPALDGHVFAVVRGAELKYRQAATDTLLAFAEPDAFTREHLVNDLATRTRSVATVLVELKDAAGNVSFSGRFEWFIARAAPAP